MIDKPKKNPGGAPKGNKNAAKPPEERSVFVGVRLANQAQRETFRALGGAAWLRKWLQNKIELERARPPKKKASSA